MTRTWLLILGGILLDGAALAVDSLEIPVTSELVDVTSDPENLYSGAPLFSAAFCGDRTQILSKYYGLHLKYRRELGIDFAYYIHEDRDFREPLPATKKEALLERPLIPVLQFALLPNIDLPESRSRNFPEHDPAVVQDYLRRYTNVVFGGGNVAEDDIGLSWYYRRNYGRVPSGPGGRIFPTAFFDWYEALLKRSTAPFMLLEYNGSYGISYAASERGLSMGCAQLFNRGGQTPCINMVASRSAARQYPYPFGIQFSGQVNLVVTNADAVASNGAAPRFVAPPCDWEPNYPKSYALCRQWLYLSWLNGARFFRWESGEFIRVSPQLEIPSPLMRSTARAAAFISAFGRTGPVQAPIAIVREFANPWDSPHLRVDAPDREGGGIDFTIIGGAPYAAGDHQLHDLVDFFYPHYVQGGMDVKKATKEDFALCATPYGSSVDLLLSDVRQEGLAPYGLLIWGGVPPESPSLVRDKLFAYLANRQGRVVLFGTAARRLFPEWFVDAAPVAVPAGTTIRYGGRALTESADFLRERLRPDSDARRSGLKVLATAGAEPLIVEVMGGLVLALSDYGLNQAPQPAPAAARWRVDRTVDEWPHRLLEHARLLLAEEATQQTPFSVNNGALHYVVTRPRPGEYLLGLFNDALTSQPFRIASRIGAIEQCEEIKLDDEQPALKGAANGAAYAPPGLRDSPALPLDYGLSDATHIEGRDVRLFRIRVQERGVREVPAVRYPDRPANRVLAVAGLEDIRHYVQSMSSFFQWFDGVAIDAAALLSLEDEWLAEQAHWLDRRGVRVVVDAATSSTDQAARAVARLAVLKKAPKNLIFASPPRELAAAAAAAGVRVLEPAAVHRLSEPGATFAPAASLNLVDLHYNNEEALYRDVRHFAARQPATSLCGSRSPAGIIRAPAAAEGLCAGVCDAGPGLCSLKAFVGTHRAALAGYTQLKVDSTYLLSKNAAALLEDAAALKGLTLRLIVDLRPDQIHFDRIALYPHLPNYARGLRLYAEILGKMKALGAKDLILRIQDTGAMRDQEKYIRQRDDTWSAFADQAAQNGIALHLSIEPGLKFSDRADFTRSNVFVIDGDKGPARSALSI